MSHRLVYCLLLISSLSPAIAEDDAPGESWWGRVRLLAADNMEGRNTGSEGYRRAAAYVAGEFQKLGLEPGGKEGFYQPMGFGVRQIDEGGSSLALVRNGQVEPLRLGEDANFGLPPDVARNIDAPAVFVG